jgi:hypothetical protein
MLVEHTPKRIEIFGTDFESFNCYIEDSPEIQKGAIIRLYGTNGKPLVCIIKHIFYTFNNGSKNNTFGDQQKAIVVREVNDND